MIKNFIFILLLLISFIFIGCEDDSNTGTSNTGTSNTETPNTGTSNTGTPNTGRTSNTGTSNTGKSNTGTSNTGTSNNNQIIARGNYNLDYNNGIAFYNMAKYCHKISNAPFTTPQSEGIMWLQNQFPLWSSDVQYEVANSKLSIDQAGNNQAELQEICDYIRVLIYPETSNIGNSGSTSSDSAGTDWSDPNLDVSDYTGGYSWSTITRKLRR